MTFIRGIYFLTAKEVKDNFTSSLTYILAGLFVLLVGWFFFSYLLGAKQITNISLEKSILTPFFGNINLVLLFICPLLAMRQFSEEKKNKTLDLLLLSDLSPTQIIIGKFISSLVTLGFMLSFILLFPIFLYFSGYSNWPLFLNAFLGTFWIAACYLSVSLFSSSLTQHQVIAAIMSFCILLVLSLLIFTAYITDNFMIGKILQYISTT